MSTSTPTHVPAMPAIATLAWRELVRFFRQRNRVIGALGQPIIFWFLFSEGFKSVDLGYNFQVPGILAMILLFTAIFTTISVIEDRNEGFLQGVLVSPVPRWAMVTGKIVGGAVIAWMQAVLFLVLGWVTTAVMARFGSTSVEQFSFGAVDVLAALALMFVMAVALTGLGFYLAWRTDSSQGYHAMMSLLLFPMWLLSGAFFPLVKESLMSYLMMANPLTYGVAGLRHHLAGGQVMEGGWLPGLGLSWGVTIAFALVMVLCCTRVVEVRTKGDFQ